MWRAPLLLLTVAAAWWFGLRPIMAEQGWTRVTQSFSKCGERGKVAQGCVVDGDSLLIGFGKNRRRIRLTGFDAPELAGACEEEGQMAIRARDALHEWLARGPFEWDGEADPPRDRYGRELREVSRLNVNGKREYLADTMIRRGLAAENGWGASPRDWCA